MKNHIEWIDTEDINFQNYVFAKFKKMGGVTLPEALLVHT